MVSGSSGHVGSDGVNSDFFNLSLEAINQKLEEKNPTELIELFDRAVKYLNKGNSKQVALLVVEKLNHELWSSVSLDLLQRISEAFGHFLDASLKRCHDNLLEEDEAKLVGSILKGGLAANSLFYLLYKAAQFKRADVFDYFLKTTAITNKSVVDFVTDNDDNSLLCVAAKNGDKEVAEFLLELGADVSKLGRCSESPLVRATRFGHKEIVELLLDRGADMNEAGTYGCKILSTAAYCGHKEIVAFLLDRGADVNEANNEGETPLYFAAFSGHKEIVELLLDWGADVNKANNRGETPLYLAVLNGNKEIVELLLRCGVEINKAKNIGITPLHAAAGYGRKEIAELLLDCEAEINNSDNEGMIPLHNALFSDSINEIVALLLDRGADVNKANNKGETPLYFAVLFGTIEILKFMLDRGANPHQTISDAGTTLRDLAMEHNNPAMLELFLTYGVS